MAKTPAAESPADKVKRELAEKKAAEQQQTADTLTAEEQAALDAADQQEALNAQTAENLNAERDKPADDLSSGKPDEEDPAIVAERKRRFEAAEAFERTHPRRTVQAGAGSVPRVAPRAPVDEVSDAESIASQAAYDKVRQLALSYPISTPPEHIICGYGGIKLTVGDIRALGGVRLR